MSLPVLPSLLQWDIPAAPEPGVAMDLSDDTTGPATPERKLPAGSGGGILGGNVKLCVLDSAGLGISYCGGLIGGGKRICVAKDCATKTHKERHFAFPEGIEKLVFIEAGVNSIYATPRVEPHKFGASIDRYLIEGRSLGGWQVFLESLEHAGFSEEDKTLLADATLEADAAGAAHFTPWKRRKLEFIDASPTEKDDSFEDVTYVGLSEDLGPSPATQLGGLVVQWSALIHDLELLKSLVTMARKGNKELEGLMKEALTAVEAKILTLNSLMGKRPASADTSSLFDLIEEGQAEAQRLTVIIGTARGDIDAAQVRIARLEKGAANASAPSSGPELRLFKDQMVISLEQALTPLRQFFLSFSSSVSAPGDTLKSELNAIKVDIAALKHQMPAPSPFVTGGFTSQWPGQAPPAPTPFSASASTAASSPMDAVKFAGLEKRVKDLENQMMSATVTMGGITFSSKAEATAWLRVNVTSRGAHTYFLDAHGLLAVAKGPGSTTEQILKMQEQMRKLGYTSVEEALLASSFGFGVPVYFGKASAAGTYASSKTLPGLKSHSDWDLGDSDRGMIYDISTAVDEVARTLEVSMQMYLAPVALSVAASMLTTTVAFVSALNEWISKFYHAQIAKGASPDETWSHISHSVREIWGMLHAARVFGRGPFATPEDRAAGTFWGILQAHAVMKELMLAKFVSHPKLSHILNLHLRDNAVMKSDFQALKARIDSLMAELAALDAVAVRPVFSDDEKAIQQPPRADPTPPPAEEDVYGISSTVRASIRTETNPVRIGILSAYNKPAFWPLYISRFGHLEWSDDPRQKTGPHSAANLLTTAPVDLVLVEHRRIPPSHPVWDCAEVQAVVSFEVWRGAPDPSRWDCYMRVMSHKEVGGVTDGKFKIFVAARSHHRVRQLFPQKPAAAARLIHILDPLEKGKRTQIPAENEHPLGTNEEGLLFWNHRKGNISSPTVFSKVNWFERKLSLKEMVSVLDLPPGLAKNPSGTETKIAVMTTPGKIYVRVLEEVSEMIMKQGKRRRSEEPLLPILRPIPSGATSAQARPKMDFNPHVKDSPSPEASTQRIATNTAKATKADDAEVPVFLWDDQVRRVTKSTVSDEILRSACDTFRNRWMLLRWKRNVLRSFCNWYRKQATEKLFLDESDALKSRLAGRKAVVYASQCSWWNWDGGSFPFFWRWEKAYQRDIRDGLAPRFLFEPPACFDRQKAHKDPDVRRKEREKIDKVIRRGYLVLVALRFIKSLMHYFSVPKGTDIRMVYDGSKSGLNAALYCPWFAVPTSASLERVITPGTYQADNDFGDMFLNFQLHEELQKYTGVDVSDLFPELGGKGEVCVAWDRPAMGLKSSPYTAVQCSTRAKRMILGDHLDPKNPFAWDRIDMNLPGMRLYDPEKPWMAKMRRDGRLASDAKAYIDDYRETGHDALAAWQASSRVAKIIGWLGMQDSARKRRGPSLSPGAWSGSVIHASGGQVRKMVTKERWDKTKNKISWISGYVRGSPQPPEDVVSCSKNEIPHKKLESYRGFLIYVSRTYTSMVPYLKGIHLTLDSWRAGRSKSGWKEDLDENDGCNLANVIDDKFETLEMRRDQGAPDKVRMVERLADDVAALMTLTAGEEPPEVLVRPADCRVAYLFADAAKAGFGSSTLKSGAVDIDADWGTWGLKTRDRSSNFRECGNFVRRVEYALRHGLIPRGTELFLFTDNFVTESVYHKGAAKSKKLHWLVQRLRKLEIEGSLFIHVIWVAGTRMIDQGSDGLSRGDLTAGAMGGKDFLSYIPLHQSALERSPCLLDWINDTFPWQGTWDVLDPSGWFTRGHDDGNFIWSAPPAVADAVLEEMCEAILCRPWNTHIFICPALMTARWRKQLRKVSDLMITVPVGSRWWPAILGKLKTPTDWQSSKAICLQCGLRIGALKGVVCANYGWRRSLGIPVCYGAWHAECYQQAKEDKYPVLVSSDLDDSVLDTGDLVDEDPKRFKEARDGDFLVCPFQCDTCHFVNTVHRLPDKESSSDKLLQVALRRAILDSLWARERATVESNRREGLRFLAESNIMGIDHPYPARGPFPIEDQWGIGTAVVMLNRSMAKGINSEHVQYETIRKMRSHVSNFVHTTPGGMGDAFITSDSVVSGVTNSPTNTLWFKRFMAGCHRRMGDVWCPDRPFAIQEALGAQKLLEDDWRTFENDPEGRLKTAITGVMLTSGLGGGLRGEEVNRLELGVIRKHWKEGQSHVEKSHVPLGMIGRFKKQVGEKKFIQPLANRSNSGLEYRLWMHRMVVEYAKVGTFNGPVFRIAEPKLLRKFRRAKVGDLDNLFHPLLKRLQDANPELISAEVKVEDEYSISRSLKRGATSQARNMNIPGDVIAANNRWRSAEKSRGCTPHMSLLERYADARAVIPLLVRFSEEL